VLGKNWVELKLQSVTLLSSGFVYVYDYVYDESRSQWNDPNQSKIVRI